jgi:hypothetical protein
MMVSREGDYHAKFQFAKWSPFGSLIALTKWSKWYLENIKLIESKDRTQNSLLQKSRHKLMRVVTIEEEKVTSLLRVLYRNGGGLSGCIYQRNGGQNGITSFLFFLYWGLNSGPSP